MSCTPDQNALGLALPCASGIEGYLKEKQENNGPILAPGEIWSAAYRFGCLSADLAQTLNDKTMRASIA
ncbi:hypothetical protein [Rhizobium hidalgonense]|uniref:hypothetical protein n=1 Tax=Rhizobium hidalgonense TaxID=1538159 RepID=UPI001105FA45|nr:hypothetical protein [Rhizobium hidalgonense]QKK27829.1 hypothetical protein FFM81_031305 [Rhizobium hidalgonense]